jgi:hypothetical protein
MSLPGIAAPVYRKPTLERGRPVTIRCVELAGQVFRISGGPVRIVSLEDEWLQSVEDPETVLAELRRPGAVGADLLTFRQPVSDVVPRHPYPMEDENLAVLKVSSYQHWLSSQINANARSRVRKAARSGITVREVEYDDAFVAGLTRIFNESPMRQGRPFWHYGKSEETVREQFSRFLHRETLLAAFLDGEMVGALMLSRSGAMAVPSQIIASLGARDKGASNALVAKAVETCERLGIRYFVYFHWSDDSLSEFKRRCGFECVSVPRYHVPLTTRGTIALRLGVHGGLGSVLPSGLRSRLKLVRARLLHYKYGAGD